MNTPEVISKGNEQNLLSNDFLLMGNLILILDEIDQLVNKTGDNALYNLTRINENEINSQISIIGISNDIMKEIHKEIDTFKKNCRCERRYL